uniref:Uncharacterized protein n=1 Tax=Psilocybe cubensis TaxID=181762 RepID=A0A8H8CGM2_PSICU
MTDLTVLVSPMPLHPVPSGNFTFGRRSFRAQNRPIMVTLETEVDEEADGQKPVVESPTNGDFIDPPTSPPRRPRPPRVVEPDLLAPPVNTWKSRPRHRPTRSQSAPPERRVAPPVDLSASQEEGSQEQKVFYKEALGFKQRNPNRSFTAFNLNRHTNQGGELVRPPPPLLRPTTFWRKTKRSGVTGASYSPSSHLIRRSTYIAAGLSFDAPIHDLSALCVESRVGFIVVPPDQSLL